MKRIEVKENDEGQRLDRFLIKTFESLPKSMMFKQIRKKNIKVNKKRCTPETIIKNGDIIELYLSDDMLKEREVYYDFLRAPKELNVVYEDENVILVNKAQGVLCHPDGKEYVNNLTSSLKRYLFEKGEWNPENENVFSPAFANRIDRNTGGIVIGAKNYETLKTLTEKIRQREIEKYYLTIAEGVFKEKSAVLEGYLIKDEKKNQVTVLKSPENGAKKSVTKYRVLDEIKNFSLVEVELLTGRTHQIRAQLADIGHPLYGDGKYGKKHGRFKQELYSYKVKFSFSDEGKLGYLSGKEFQLTDCPVIKKFSELKSNGE